MYMYFFSTPEPSPASLIVLFLLFSFPIRISSKTAPGLLRMFPFAPSTLSISQVKSVVSPNSSIHPFHKSFAKRKKNAQFDFPPCHAVAGIYHFHHPHVAILLTGPFAETRSLTRLFCSDAMPHLPSLRLAVKGDKGRIAATSITADVGCSPLLILPEGC